MDPVTALSVAAAVVQFVDFSAKLVCKSKEIYRSADGILQANKETETVVMRLKELAKAINRQGPRRTGNTNSSFSRLRVICAECEQISNSLVERLHRLEVPVTAHYRKWKSFRQALKSVWSKEEIDTIAAKLASLRAELDTEVLVLMRESIDNMSIHTREKLASVDANTQAAINELLTIRNSHQEIHRQFEGLGDSQRSSIQHLTSLVVQQITQFRQLDENTRRILQLLIERNARQDEGSAAAAELLVARRSSADLVERDSYQQAHRARRVELSILESLRFPDMTHRPESISPAHVATFEWIFRDPTANQKPWTNFGQWLSTETGLYWIQGKPASGKSTLMHYIWNHQRTHTLLNQWARGSHLVLGAFYFWNSGSKDQRSHAGLLRTLLYSVLSQNRKLVLDVFKQEWQHKRDLVIHDLDILSDQWSLGRLQEAFRDLIRLAGPERKMCFFLDGLDEYEGDPGDIADYISGLAGVSYHVKFCVSSRPLSAFQSVFHDAPGLKLQDLTKGDIQRYVNDKLGRNRHMQQLLQSNPHRSNWLISEIVDRAAGVFLWVILVVKSLVNGFRNGESISHLCQLLEALPVDLENLFAHILERIEPECREESSKMFQIFRANGDSLSVVALHRALLYTQVDEVINAQVHSMTTMTCSDVKEEEEKTVQQMRLRISSRCRGLLEVSEIYDKETLSPDQVAPQGPPVHMGSSIHAVAESTSGIHNQKSADPNQSEFHEQSAATRSPDQFIPDSISSLPDDAHYRVREALGKECLEFVESQAAMKFYIEVGHLPPPGSPHLYPPNHPITIRDSIYSTAIWLKDNFGGEILAWLYLILEERRQIAGSPKRGLLNEFQQFQLQRGVSNEFESSDFALEARDAQDLGDPKPSTGRKQNYSIVYLHRTLSDFLKQPRNWSTIAEATRGTGFDPQIALLMEKVVEAKTTLITNVFETGMKWLRQVRNLQITPSSSAVRLIEELDRVLNLLWTKQGGQRHWSSADPTAEGLDRSEWADDLDSASIQTGLLWLPNARQNIISNANRARQQNLPLPYLAVVPRAGLPLLSYALSFHTWASRQPSCPHLGILQQLLSGGADPNVLFQGHSIWQFLIHQIHNLRYKFYDEHYSNETGMWIQSAKLFLLHGADPYACCLEDSRLFDEAVGFPKTSYADSTLSTCCHEWERDDLGSRRGVDDAAWDVDYIHGYHHSITAVIKDAFVRTNHHEVKDLQAVLEQRKRQERRPQKRKRREDYNERDYKSRPDWVS